MGLAAEALVWVLGEDPRVQAAYAAWEAGVLARRLPLGRGIAVTSVAAVLGTMQQNRARDLETLTRLVRNDLHLDYQWLPGHLLADFGQAFVGRLTGALGVGIRLVADIPADIPR